MKPCPALDKTPTKLETDRQRHFEIIHRIILMGKHKTDIK